MGMEPLAAHPQSRFLHSRFLVLVALQPSHLTLVHLGRVHVCVHHELVLPDAGRAHGA